MGLHTFIGQYLVLRIISILEYGKLSNLLSCDEGEYDTNTR